MTKIPRSVHAEIALKAAVLGFKVEVQKFLKKEYALINEVANKAYPKKLRECMAEIENISLKEFSKTPIDTTSHVTVTVGGQYQTLGCVYFGDEYVYKTLFGYERPDIKVFNFHNGRRSYMLALMADDKLGMKIVEHVNARESLNNEILTAITQVLGAMTNIRTMKQCQDQWPEILPIVESVMPEVKLSANLPAVLREELNATLNLPPELPYPSDSSNDALEVVA